MHPADNNSPAATPTTPATPAASPASPSTALMDPAPGPLRDPAYRSWFFSQALSSAGVQTQTIGAAWVVYLETHSGVALALIPVATLGPGRAAGWVRRGRAGPAGRPVGAADHPVMGADRGLRPRGNQPEPEPAA